MPKTNPQRAKDLSQAVRKAILSQRGKFTADDLRKHIDSENLRPAGAVSSRVSHTLRSLLRQQEIVALPGHGPDKRLVYAICKPQGEPHG